jgi:branched-chain amino acid transport system ATP-binding protein
MIGRPRLVLIDEPSEGLVPMIVVDIFAIITEMKQTGAIVLLVEQNVHGALESLKSFRTKTPRQLPECGLHEGTNPSRFRLHKT